MLTDARAFQFFQLYDLYGPGFACEGGWAKNKLSAALHGIYFTDDTSKWSTKPGVAKAVKYNPNPPSPPIPEAIPERLEGGDGSLPRSISLLVMTQLFFFQAASGRGQPINYLISIIFLTSCLPPNSNWTRYVPLAWCVASKITR